MRINMLGGSAAPIAVVAAFLLLTDGRLVAQSSSTEMEFPVAAEIFIDSPFNSCEGLGFSGEGLLYVTCNQGLYQITAAAQVKRIADLQSNLGVAGIGERDVLVADFGPTNAFQHDRNTDGIVWRITPEGGKTAHALGIGDPNFILVRADGSYLVSDDATSDIYLVQADGAVSLFTTAVNHPNGLALSLDESVLYVAQMFTSIRPVVGVNMIWAIRLQDGKPIRDAKLVARTGPGAFVDGLATDSQGRIYIASNREGRIWRYDPQSEDIRLIAEDVFGAASIAFGEGDFDRQSIYVTTTFSNGLGGKVWRIPVGIEGAPLHR